jgi:hypothetical protein
MVLYEFKLTGEGRAIKQQERAKYNSFSIIIDEKIETKNL